MFKQYKLIFLFLTFFKLAFSQNCDTLKINQLLLEAEQQRNSELDKSYTLSFQAFELAKNCPHSKKYIETALALERAYYFKDEHDSILALLLPIEKNELSYCDKKSTAAIYQRIGSAYGHLLKLDEALKYGLKALTIYEALNDTISIINLYVNIGYTYNNQKNVPLALKYYSLAENLAIKGKHKSKLAQVYNNYGILYGENRKFEESLTNFLKSTQLREELKDSLSLINNYNNLGGLYTLMGKNTEAILYLEKTLVLANRFDNLNIISAASNNLGNLYTNIGKYDKALAYYNTARSLYLKTKNPQLLEDLYSNLSIFYDAKGDLKTAFIYSDSLIVLKDSLYGVRLSEQMAEMQTKFDVEKKDLEILNSKTQLESEKAQSRIKTIVGISILCLFGLLGILLFSYYRNKKEKEKRDIENLSSIRIIESEQQERMRIARELHDGIGQKLTVLKMYTGEENKLQSNLLEETINEVRSISHKMMPEIINLGLIPAVKDLCEKINNSGTIKCLFVIDEFSESIKFAKDIELSIYRIVQEVVNNMLKHAKAKQITVNFFTLQTNLKISITDDGVGFDTKKIHTSSGIGWSNIITRAKIIKANLDINSSNNGTSIVLNISI
jgi:two-component system, NarL family, sensor kinase